MDDKILLALGELRREVAALTRQVAEHDRKLRWVTSAALLVIGIIGGPNAVDLITSGAV